ncbi:MAG: portal protein, partial [Xanthobacteraceae bacterium]
MSYTDAGLRQTSDPGSARDPRPSSGTTTVARFGESQPRNPTAQDIRGEGEETDEDILYEARERFRRSVDWEGDFRARYIDDVKFANGDSDNHWQWPDSLYGERGAQRPALTVNKTRQHCLQVINDAKQNKPQIRITPVSDEATKASADVFEGVVRHIEYESNAQVAYDTATESQVQGGIGWWRITTEYEDESSLNLACRIKRIRDALSVYDDPDIQEVDGSDRKWLFIVDDVARDQFKLKYPEYQDRIPQGTWAGAPISGGWLDQDHVRVAEYFRLNERTDTVHQMPDGSTIREGELQTDQALDTTRQLSLARRRITKTRVEWFKIVGGEIVDEAIWPGRYIPLIRIIGEEQVIEGRLERKGHVRALKDPQRIYNYWSSSAVESVALQSKTPYVAAAESIEGHQKYWDTANTTNHSVLPFNARDDQGNPLPPPQRQEPPQMAQAYISGLQIAQSEMSMATGQYQPTMGQPSPNEISGKAITARQRQGDNATYHFVDNLAIGIRFTGRILIDLIPKIYDTPRIMRILARDGTVDRIQLNPQQPQALQSVPNPGAPAAAGGITPPTPQQAMAASVTRIFNPLVGTYEVQADVGPAYATKRQEAFNAFTQIIQTAPQVMGIAGDLLFKAADFPMAEELAERLQRLVPPQALGQGPSPEVQQMQTQLQGAQAHIALLGEKLAVAEMKLKARDEQTDIDAYKAVTDRMGSLLSMKGTDSPYADGMEV